ncbi:MAG: hypothetical protein KKF95_00080, partial [Nanoarchaeota archaeon]|nr:hypothetical protein [Nanoarchaeota archaeon]
MKKILIIIPIILIIALIPKPGEAVEKCLDCCPDVVLPRDVFECPPESGGPPGVCTPYGCSLLNRYCLGSVCVQCLYSEHCPSNQVCTSSSTCTCPTDKPNWNGASCVALNCTLPHFGDIKHGQSITAYKLPIIPYGENCALEPWKEQRICNNGVLSGSYKYSNCKTECDPRYNSPCTRTCFTGAKYDCKGISGTCTCECTGGTFTPSCPPASTIQCGVPITGCGTCTGTGTYCGGGSFCNSANTCQCPSDKQNWCDACTNIETDVNNCGGCGTKCPTGQTCTGGKCTCTPTSWTPSTSSKCGTFTQTSNCGTTRTATGDIICGGGSFCNSANTCQCPSDKQNWCDACTNIETDVNNCGGCGTKCPTGQ